MRSFLWRGEAELKHDVSGCLIKPSMKQVRARWRSGRSYNRGSKRKSNCMKGSACWSALPPTPDSPTSSLLEILTPLRTQTVMHGNKIKLERKEALKPAQGAKQIRWKEGKARWEDRTWTDSRGTERHLFSIRDGLQPDRDTKERERE